MKEKIELKLTELKEAKENLLKELQKIKQADNNTTGQIIACNGAIDILEKLLKEGE